MNNYFKAKVVHLILKSDFHYSQIWGLVEQGGLRSQPAEKEGWKGVLLFQLGVNSRLWDIMNMHMYFCVLVFVYIYRDHCYMNG